MRGAKAQSPGSGDGGSSVGAIAGWVRSLLGGSTIRGGSCRILVAACVYAQVSGGAAIARAPRAVPDGSRRPGNFSQHVRLEQPAIDRLDQRQRSLSNAETDGAGSWEGIAKGGIDREIESQADALAASARADPEKWGTVFPSRQTR